MREAKGRGWGASGPNGMEANSAEKPSEAPMSRFSAAPWQQTRLASQLSQGAGAWS